MFGPVFGWELVRSGRHRWHWWARVLYLAVLFFFLYVAYQTARNQMAFSNNLRTATVMQRTATHYYAMFRVCQLMAVLILAPVYGIQSVLIEKSRRTMDFLLASPLFDWEIVLDKILLALVRVWEVVLAGLPLCALCWLFGGLDPATVLCDFLVTMAAAWASCALGVLVAVAARKFIEAILVVFLIHLVWYVYPAVVLMAAVGGNNWLRSLDFLVDMNAFVAVYRGWTPVTWLGNIYTSTIAATSVFGLTGLLVSWRLIRPAWQAHFGGQATGVLRWVRAELWKSPKRAPLPVEGPPMRWKESRHARWTAFQRVTALTLVLIVLTVLAIQAAYYLETQAMLLQQRFGAPPMMVLAAYLLYMFGLPFLVLPAIGVLGAGAFAEEKEKGLLEQLFLAEVQQDEVVDAKLLRISREALLTVAMLLLPLGPLWLVGFHTNWTAPVVSVRLLTGAMFWLLLGLAFGLHLGTIRRAAVTVLACVIAVEVVFPIMLLMMDESNFFSVACVGTTINCIVEMLTDNTSEAFGRPGNLTRLELRLCTVCWSFVYLMAAIGAGMACRVRVPPWGRPVNLAFTRFDEIRDVRSVQNKPTKERTTGAVGR